VAPHSYIQHLKAETDKKRAHVERSLSSLKICVLIMYGASSFARKFTLSLPSEVILVVLQCVAVHVAVCVAVRVAM